jgi:hypothetical protein
MNVTTLAKSLTVCLFLSGLALGQSDKALDTLRQLGPEYNDYRVLKVSLPVDTSSISLKVVGKVTRFAHIVGGKSETVPLADQEKQEVAKTFERVVTAAISNAITVRDDSKYRLVVVSGEGGGVMIGAGGIITATLFLLNTQDRALLSDSSEYDSIGKGSTLDGALNDLAVQVAKRFSKMAKPAK